ncbi:hypothetical protein OSTOST_14670 [Ostertagia ostertagi]
MSDDLDREIQLLEFERQTSMDAIRDTLQSITTRLDSLFAMVGEMKQDVRTLLDRTAPKSSCVFCLVNDNVDNHLTSRCHRYPDPISRAMRISELRLCERCLRQEHGAAVCTVTCNNCRGPHNTVLCAGHPIRKRKL